MFPRTLERGAALVQYSILIILIILYSRTVGRRSLVYILCVRCVTLETAYPFGGIFIPTGRFWGWRLVAMESLLGISLAIRTDWKCPSESGTREL